MDGTAGQGGHFSPEDEATPSALFPAPVTIVNSDGSGQFVLACEHAGKNIPDHLDSLGLDEADLNEHIAWDIGAEELARALARQLDAPTVLQRYSRLICDCNRPPEAAGSILVEADGRTVPGNLDLSAQERELRYSGVYKPFHDALSRILDVRSARGLDTILVTVHSFTPVFKGRSRDVHVGIIHEGENPFAENVLRALSRNETLVCRSNDPYGPEDGVTHTLALHGKTRGLKHAMIEVRNDLIADKGGQELWAERLAAALKEAAKNGAAE